MTSLDSPTSTPAAPGDPQPDSPARPPTVAPVRSRVQPAAWIVSLALAAVVGALLFVGGYLAAGGHRQTSSCSAPTSAFAAFCDAYEKLKSQYVDKLDDAKLAEGAIQGMFQDGVKDPFSGYM